MKKMTLILIFIIFSLSACKPVDINAPAPIYDTGIDPASWVEVPAGEFFSGQFNFETLIDYDYEIMVTHVTNQQFADYLNDALEGGYIKISGEEVVGYYPERWFNSLLSSHIYGL